MIARRLVEEEAKVVVLDGDAAAAKAALEGTGADVYACNTSDYEDTIRCFDKIKAELGEVDILVTNPQEHCRKTMVETTPEEWNAIMAADVHSLFYCAKQVCASMKERKSGKVINVSSRSFMGDKGDAAYVVAKAAVHGFTGTLCTEMVKYGVTGNVVTPNDDAAPEDIADAIAFLSSEDSRFAHRLNVTVARKVVVE